MFLWRFTSWCDCNSYVFSVDSFTLLAIPFFIAACEIMNESGITDKIVSFSKALVGHIKGGLAHVSIVSSMFFSGISGSATADASALGSMLIPAMKKSCIDPDFDVDVSAISSDNWTYYPS